MFERFQRVLCNIAVRTKTLAPMTGLIALAILLAATSSSAQDLYNTDFDGGISAIENRAGGTWSLQPNNGGQGYQFDARPDVALVGLARVNAAGSNAWQNYTAEATMRFASTTNASSYGGIAVRMADFNNYLLLIVRFENNAWIWSMSKVINGGGTRLGSGSVAFSGDTNTTFRLAVEVSGNQVMPKLAIGNGAMNNLAESSYTVSESVFSAGSIGLAARGGAVMFDNWRAIPPSQAPANVAVNCTPSSGIVPFSVSCTGSATGSNLTWTWRQNGAVIGNNAATVSTSFSSTGAYTIEGTASNSVNPAGISASTVVTAGGTTTPVLSSPAVSCTPSTGTAPLAISCTGSVLGGLATWAWQANGTAFGGNGAIVNTTLSSANTYTIRGTATPVGGGTNVSATTQVTVTNPSSGGVWQTVPDNWFSNLQIRTWKHSNPQDPSSWIHPGNESEMNTFFNTFATPANLCGNGSVARIFTQYGDNNPFVPGNAGCSHDFYAAQIEGTISVPTTGTYQFAVDGDDAVDVYIDSAKVASWYGGHGTCNCTTNGNTGQVYLTAGTHTVKLRMEEMNGGDSWELKVLPPAGGTTPVLSNPGVSCTPTTGTAPLEISCAGGVLGGLATWAWQSNGVAFGGNGSIVNTTLATANTYIIRGIATPVGGGASVSATTQLTVTNANSGVTTHSYDARGNRTAVGSATVNYDGDDRPQSGNLDANGNNLGQGNVYTYDAANRLVGSSNGISYHYDALGNLVRMIQNGQATEFVWDERGELPRLMAEVRQDGSKTLYVYGPDGLHARNDINAASVSVVSFPIADDQGTITQWIRGDRSVVQTISYDPWGNITGTTGNNPSGLAGPVVGPGYTGALHLPDGNVYLRSRIYNPASGRFLQRDSFAGYIDRPQSLNRFAYVEGNVATWTDPSGYASVGHGVGNMIGGAFGMAGGAATVAGSGALTVGSAGTLTPGTAVLGGIGAVQGLAGAAQFGNGAREVWHGLHGETDAMGDAANDGDFAAVIGAVAGVGSGTGLGIKAGDFARRRADTIKRAADDLAEAAAQAGKWKERVRNGVRQANKQWKQWDRSRQDIARDLKKYVDEGLLDIPTNREALTGSLGGLGQALGGALGGDFFPNKVGPLMRIPNLQGILKKRCPRLDNNGAR